VPASSLDSLIAHYNVSPKLANSGMREDLRISPEAVTWFTESPKTWFKFVVQDKEDLAEVAGLRDRFGISPDRIFLMPEGRTPAALAERRLWLAGQCRDLGYRFSDRLHLQLWGSARGR
jgi:hypothetical protein